MLISCCASDETLGLITNTIKFVFLVAWFLVLIGLAHLSEANIQTGSEEQPLKQQLNLNNFINATSNNQILRLINNNHNYEPTLTSSPTSRNNNNKFVVISEGSRVRTRPYDFIYDLSSPATNKANKSSQPFEPSMRNFYLLTAEINQQPNSNQKQNQNRNQNQNYTNNQTQIKPNSSVEHLSNPETTIEISRNQIDDSDPIKINNNSSQLKRTGDTTRSEHNLGPEARVSLLAPRVKLNFLRQKLGSYSRRPSRTKFFRLISSAHSPIQFVADDLEPHLDPGSNFDSDPSNRNQNQNQNQNQNWLTLTNRSRAESRSDQTQTRFPAIDPLGQYQQLTGFSQLAQVSTSQEPNTTTLAQTATEEAPRTQSNNTSLAKSQSQAHQQQVLQPTAGSLQYSELPAISDGRLVSPALWVSDDEGSPSEPQELRKAQSSNQRINSQQPYEQQQDYNAKQAPDELVRAAQNNLTVLDPIPEADPKKSLVQQAQSNDDTQLDDRSHLVTFSQTGGMAVKPPNDGLTHLVVVKSGSNRMRPVTIMRHRPLTGSAHSAHSQPNWLDRANLSTLLENVLDSQTSTETGTGKAKPLQFGALVIKKDSKQRVKIAIPQQAPNQNLNNFSHNYNRTIGFASATTSSPQLVRLISKQRHKHEDRVTSPTLTVIDNDAVRVPFNATSVHNNKLIVTIRPGRPYRRQPLTPTTQFPVYNIVAGITPPYLTGALPGQTQSTKPPVRQNYGLISKLPDDAGTRPGSSTPIPFRATNLKFPAQVPSSLMVDRGPETQMSIIDKINISVPANDPSILRPSKLQPPNRIQMETEEQLVRPPTETIVVSDTTVVSRPYGSNVSHHGSGIIKLSTTRRPLKPPPTKKINIVSANTTLVTGNPEDVHDALTNFIAESHHPSSSGQNRPSNRPGILEFLNNVVNTGVATSAFAILTLVKTIFISLFILFLPPIALTAAIMQAVSG